MPQFSSGQTVNIGGFLKMKLLVMKEQMFSLQMLLAENCTGSSTEEPPPGNDYYLLAVAQKNH